MVSDVQSVQVVKSRVRVASRVALAAELQMRVLLTRLISESANWKQVDWHVLVEATVVALVLHEAEYVLDANSPHRNCTSSEEGHTRQPEALSGIGLRRLGLRATYGLLVLEDEPTAVARAAKLVELLGLGELARRRVQVLVERGVERGKVRHLRGEGGGAEGSGRQLARAR